MNEHWLHEYFAGATSGIAGLVVGHPFDTTKVQLQTRKLTSPYRNLWQVVSTINKSGWTDGFYRGMSFPLVTFAAVNSILFGVYSNMLRLMGDQNKPKLSSVTIASTTSALCMLSIAVPADLAKVILQSQIPQRTCAPSGHVFYSGPVECLRVLYREQGIRGWYRGGLVMGVRDVPATIIYMTSFHAVYDQMMVHGYSDKRGLVASFVGGGIAGVLSWVAIMPIDYVKSAIQADVTQKYSSVTDCILYNYKHGGIRCFFTGTLVTALRAFPVNAVIFVVYTQLMSRLSSQYQYETYTATI